MKSFLFIFIVFPFFLFAQEDIVLKTFVKSEGFVQLRWAPTKPELFQEGLRKGYEIIRSGPDGEKIISIGSISERKADLANLTDSTALEIIEFAEGLGESKDEEMIKQSFGMLTLAASSNQQIAKVLGVYFEDTGMASGSYTYLIKIKGTDAVSPAVKVNSKKADRNPPCSELTGFSRIDLKEAYLDWEAKELNESYGGYFIYKSENKIDFTRLNETAMFHFTSQYEPDKTVINFVDTAVVEGATYYYKVQPINHFGDPGIESNIVEVYIQKRLMGYCVIDTVESAEFERRIVGFYEGTADETVKEFVFMRSDSIMGPYTELEKKPGTENKFLFEYKSDLTSGDRHYFKVAAVSIDNDTAYSHPYYHFSLDQEPPGLPENLAGIVDSNGVAKLSWTPPTDQDLLGYRVFRSNSLNEEFVEITTTLKMDTIFSDTLDLNNLTSEIYYRVRAVDQNYNNGKTTAPVLLMKPDTIPPIPAAIVAYEVRETGVFLKWVNSTSSDLTRQFLIREYQNRPDTLLRFIDEHDSILDITGRLGLRYNYYLISSDESANVSQSGSLPIKFEIGYRPEPVIESAEANVEQKHILLTWNKILEPIYSIQIYRAKNDGNFKLYKTIRENVSEFEDTQLTINNEYHYKIKISYPGGISSKMSAEVSVMF